MDINWLPGGPYFEVSILAPNRESREGLVSSFIQKLGVSRNKVELAEDRPDVEEKANTFIVHGSDSIDLNIWATVAGKRRARFFVAILSDELVLIDFWFLGDEFSSQPITKKEQPRFKRFLEEMLSVFDGIVGTLGWEADCQSLFDTKSSYPHKDYSMRNLRSRLNGKTPTGIEYALERTGKPEQ